MDSLNSEPARILKKELAHSFNQMVQRTMSSGGHEGIAQALDQKNVGSACRNCSAIQQEIPCNTREGGGMRFLYL